MLVHVPTVMLAVYLTALTIKVVSCISLSRAFDVKTDVSLTML